ncbi:MAG: ABC transporter transmembrane domain-containing protein, partial [Shewanella sp.]
MTASPKDEMWTVFKRLMGYLKPMKGMFLLSVVGLIVYGLVDAAFISFIGPFIDKGFSSSAPAISNGIALPTSQGFHADNQVLLMAPIVVILMFSLRGFANFVSTYGISYMSARLIMDMRQQVFQHYLSLPVSYMDKENTGNLISKVTFDTEQIARASGSALISIVRDSVTVIGMLGLMFYNSWKLSLCILVIGPIMGVVITIVSRRFRKVSKQ